MRKLVNKIILLSLFFGFVVLLYIFQVFDNLDSIETELENYNTKTSNKNIEISNPIFKSKGLDTNSYIIKAKRGIQNEGSVELHDISAEFEGDNDKIFYINADIGYYNHQNETIELNENVIIIDELNNKTSTKNAFIEITTKKITLTKEVESISSNSLIRSDFSVLDDINKTIVYSGNVSAKIKNE